MSRLVWVLVSVLCCSGASASELVRVRVSQFDGSEPAAISSTSHPQLFVLDPSIASAELVATNPADPRKEDLGPARWLPEMTPAQGLPLEFGAIELRIKPVAGALVAFGALHFRTEVQSRGDPFGFWLDGVSDPDFPWISRVSLASPATATFVLEAPASDQASWFRWSSWFASSPGGPAGFSGVDLIVATPLCEPEPREECEAATRSRLSIDRSKGGGGRLGWRWRIDGSALDDFGSPDDAPLFALCLYDERGLIVSSLVGPDVCGDESCWRERPRGFRFESPAADPVGIAALKVKQSRHGVSGSLDAGFMFWPSAPGAEPPPTALPYPVAVGDVRAQLVRSDEGACVDAGFTLPAKVHTETRFVDSLR